MVTNKVSVGRKWLEPVPEENGRQIPRSEWVKKRRHCWIVRWYSTAGRRHGKLFDKRKEAERHARKLQALVDSGRQDEPSKITLRQFVEEHKTVMKGQVAHATLMDQLRALQMLATFLGEDVLLQRISARNAEAFIASRIESGLTTGEVPPDYVPDVMRELTTSLDLYSVGVGVAEAGGIQVAANAAGVRYPNALCGRW